MKFKFILSSVVFIFGTASSHAADVIYHTPDTPTYDEGSIWGGAYIGGQVGYSWFKSQLSDDDDVYISKTNGFMGGIYAGYNWEFSNAYLFGVEGDINYADLSHRKHVLYSNTNSDWDTRIQWEGSLRARFGVNYERILPYIAGGLALAGIQNEFSNLSPFDDSKTRTHVGYTIGAGVDYALTNNLILRAEYRYSNYGKKTVLFDTIENKLTTNNVRLGLAYKF